MKKLVNSHKTQSGFTLVEVLLVVIILAVISTIAVQKVSGSSDKARMNADIATARQVQAALDRFEVEHGVYPELTDDDNGTVVNDSETDTDSGTPNFIPEYINKLDSTVTQQREGNDLDKGFGVETLSGDGSSDPSVTNVIMIYLTTDGTAAEVKAYSTKDTDDSNVKQIWPIEIDE